MDGVEDGRAGRGLPGSIAGGALIGFCVGWFALGIVALWLLHGYGHVFDTSRVAWRWYASAVATAGGIFALSGAVLGVALSRVRLPLVDTHSWIFGLLVAGAAAVPVSMWLVYDVFAIHALMGALVLASLAAALVSLGLVAAPLAAVLYARAIGTVRLVVLCALETLAVVLVAAFTLEGTADPSPPGAVSPAAAGESPAPAFPPNIVLVTADALRADHLSLYGYARPTSPVVDRLAAQGTRAHRFYANRPKTSPNFASMFTGLYPARHRVRLSPAVLAPEHTALAEVLSASGYETYAVVENIVLEPQFGFAQGFRRYEHIRGDPGPGTERVVHWLREGPPEPFFLWRHYVDPHAPYEPRAPYVPLREAWDDSASPLVPFNERGSAVGGTHRPGAPRRLASQVAAYDAEIRGTDDQLAEILAALDAGGLRDRTVVIFSADHGESLGEHDYYFEHGLVAYDTNARIPLVVAVPARLGLGTQRPRVDRTLESVDLFPTILALAGSRAPDAVDGRSLLPWLFAGQDDGDPGLAFVEAGDGDHIGRGWLDAVVRGRWKYVRRRVDWVAGSTTPRGLLYVLNALYEGGLDPHELYDLDADPGESRNLAATEVSVARELQAVLERHLAQLPPSPPSVSHDDNVAFEELDPATRDALERLGYGR